MNEELEFVYWLHSPGSLRGIIDDEDPLFLRYQVVIGPAAGCFGRCSKRLTDYNIKTGHLEIITNPLEAFALVATAQVAGGQYGYADAPPGQGLSDTERPG